jgi:hypothetical protein
VLSRPQRAALNPVSLRRDDIPDAAAEKKLVAKFVTVIMSLPQITRKQA